MTELTPEQRLRIYEEEKARIETEELAKAKTINTSSQPAKVKSIWSHKVPEQMARYALGLAFLSVLALGYACKYIGEFLEAQAAKQQHIRYEIALGKMIEPETPAQKAEREKLEADQQKAVKSAKERYLAELETRKPLTLISSNWYIEDDYFYYEGEIENASTVPLSSIEAVASFYSENGQFIKSDIALIDFSPLMPGQSSPFKVMSRYHPLVAKARVDFKTLRGEQLEYREPKTPKGQ